MKNLKINIENHWKNVKQVKKLFYFSAVLLKQHKFAKKYVTKFLLVADKRVTLKEYFLFRKKLFLGKE